MTPSGDAPTALTPMERLEKAARRYADDMYTLGSFPGSEMSRRKNVSKAELGEALSAVREEMAATQARLLASEESERLALRNNEGLRGEVSSLREDAMRYRWMLEHAEWYRGVGDRERDGIFIALRKGCNLVSRGSTQDEIDKARALSPGAAQTTREKP
jgi:hypothetical protein